MRGALSLLFVLALPAAAQVIPPATKPPVVTAGFQSWFSNRVYPADSAGAVSASYVAAMSNEGLAVHDRAGRRRGRVTLAEFWTEAGTYYTPRIVHDPRYDRWVAIALQETSSTVWLRVAISQSNDPLGAWSYTRFDVRRNAEFTRLAVTRDYVIAQTNAVVRSRFFAFPRAEIYTTPAGAAIPSFEFDMPRTDVAPISSDDSVANPYLAHFDGEYLQLWEVTSAREDKVRQLPDQKAPFFSNYVLGEIAPLPNFSRIDAGRTDIGHAVIRNGAIYVVHSVYNPMHTRGAAVMLWKVAVNGTLLDSRIIGDPTGRDWYTFPTIAVNRANAIVVAYSLFSQSRNPSSAFTYIGALNDEHAPALLKEGEGIPPAKLWGNYNTIVTDPVNELDFWAITAYAVPNAHWATWWTKLEMPVTRRRASRH